MIKHNNFANLYDQLLHKVLFNYDHFVSPRKLKVRECTNVHFRLTDPTNNLFDHLERPYPKKYLAGELYWYFTGRNDVSFIRQYSKFWDTICNEDDKTTNSAYGHLLFKEAPTLSIVSEWYWAYRALVDDEDSRQAIIHFNKPHHMWSNVKDFPCTLVGTFQVRNNQLNFTVVMRSQDIIKGLTFDLPFFTLLHQQMLCHLSSTYKTLRLGHLDIFVESLHLYESDFNLATRMVPCTFYVESLPQLRENLISTSGTFHPYFNESRDPLVTWIREHL